MPDPTWASVKKASWRIYYDDRRPYSDIDGPPGAAPKLGVQVIIYIDSEVGRVLLSLRDYYWLTDYGWDGGDLFGLFDYLSRPGEKLVLFGRAVRTPQYRRILAQALSDPEFPKKSAWYDWEDHTGTEAAR